MIQRPGNHYAQNKMGHHAHLGRGFADRYPSRFF